MTDTEKIKFDIDVDTEKIQDAADIIHECLNTVPNITIRNNESVYVTINNFNQTADDYFAKHEEEEEE